MSQDLGALVHILSSWVLGGCRASSEEKQKLVQNPKLYCTGMRDGQSVMYLVLCSRPHVTCWLEVNEIRSKSVAKL